MDNVKHNNSYDNVFLSSISGKDYIGRISSGKEQFKKFQKEKKCFSKLLVSLFYRDIPSFIRRFWQEIVQIIKVDSNPENQT
jgi:hypothetical protein